MSKSDQTGAVMSYYHRLMRKVLPTPFALCRSSPMRPEPLSSEVRPGRRRHSNCRYLVAADVVYQLMKNREIFSDGRGRSLNISSGGILFESETVLPVGVSIALQIVWPTKLDEHVALTLHIHGRTLWTYSEVRREPHRGRRISTPIPDAAQSPSGRWGHCRLDLARPNRAG